MAVPLNGGWPELGADAVADGLVLAHLRRLTSTRRRARRDIAAADTPDGSSSSAIHDRHIDEEMPLPAAEEAWEHDVSLAPRALPIACATVVASHSEPISRPPTRTACTFMRRATKARAPSSASLRSVQAYPALPFLHVPG